MKYGKQLVAKAVYLEWRRPETKVERNTYGLTTTNGDIARIFFNTSIKQELANTFFHEMTHVFFAFHKHKVPENVQEALALKIGAICKEILQ